MKSFKRYVTEELNTRQQYHVDRITHGADDTARDTEFSDHVFGGPSSGLGRFDDKDVKIVPFNMEQLKKPPSAIVDHLKHWGYEVHDWDKRLARSVGRGKTNPIRIGKIMANTQNSDTHYDADRALRFHDSFAKHVGDGLEIMITRHPYHVAEQSTNKGWRSCLTLGTCPDEDRGFIGDEEDEEARQSAERAEEQARRLGRAQQRPGEFSYKIEGDILGGAHMAYLIKKGDYKLKNPLARISLKPFHSEDIDQKIDSHIKSTRTPGAPIGTYRHHAPWSKIKPEHTILRPVGQTYRLQEFGGGAHPLIREFEDQVNQFAKVNFPMKSHISQYRLDALVQRDSREPDFLNNHESFKWRNDPENFVENDLPK